MLAARSKVGAVAALFVLGACRSTPEIPPPLGTPDFDTEARLLPGTTLGGAGALEPSNGGATGEGLVLHCRMLYLEEAYDEGLERLEAASALVADLFGDRPVLPIAGLTAGAGYALGAVATAWMREVEDGAAGRTRVLDERTVYLPPGSTFSFSVSAAETALGGTGVPIERSIGLWLTWTEDGPRVSISLDDLDPDVEAERRVRAVEAGEALAEPGLPMDDVMRREVVVLDVAPTRGEPLVVRLPSPFATGEGCAFAAWVELADEAEEGGAAAGAAERIAAEAADYAARTATFGLEEQDALRLSSTLEALREGGGRPALLLLAAECGASLAGDLALVADDEVLTAITDRVSSPGQPVPSSLEAIGWQLESAAWAALCARALEDGLPPALEGLLFQHAGALTRYPDVILDALAGTGDLDAFAERLAAEQRYFLEDIDPSARVRAHDWLREHGRGVAGYDPLAPRKERRAALEPRVEPEPESEADEADEADEAGADLPEDAR